MTTTPLTDAINALTTYANETTGASDTDLSSAVATLVAGYGGGGGYTIEDIATRSYPYGDIVFSEDLNLQGYEFYGRTGITSIYSDYALGGGNGYNFHSCTGLKKVFIRQQLSLGAYEFYNCTNLETAVFPMMHSLYTSAMQSDSKLKAIDCGGYNANGGLIRTNAFAGCSQLKTIILRTTSGAWLLSNINNLNNTPFASGKSGGTLYVPSALISSYQSATNWSTILGYTNNSIQAIEGSQYENYYADGTPIE